MLKGCRAMDKAELDVAVEQANRILSRQYRRVDDLTEKVGSNPFSAEKPIWPSESYHAAGRFCQPHAKLFPFTGRKVRTPMGPGTLLQVFADLVTVLLDSEMTKCAAFTSGEIEPVSWELSS